MEIEVSGIIYGKETEKHTLPIPLFHSSRLVGTEDKVLEQHEYIARMLPSKYLVTGVQVSNDAYEDVADAFIWVARTPELRAYYTWYSGDSMYKVFTELDDGNYVIFHVDMYHHLSDKDAGDRLCDAVISAVEDENEYEHKLESTYFGTLYMERGRRIAERVPLEKLLREKADLERHIESCEEIRKSATNKAFWERGITRSKEKLAEIETLITQK